MKRFIEKPGAHEITCDTINAGIYVLESLPMLLKYMPKGTPNIRSSANCFPTLLENGEPSGSLVCARHNTGSISAHSAKYLREVQVTTFSSPGKFVSPRDLAESARSATPWRREPSSISDPIIDADVPKIAQRGPYRELGDRQELQDR